MFLGLRSCDVCVVVVVLVALVVHATTMENLLVQNKAKYILVRLSAKRLGCHLRFETLPISEWLSTITYLGMRACLLTRL